VKQGDLAKGRGGCRWALGAFRDPSASGCPKAGRRVGGEIPFLCTLWGRLDHRSAVSLFAMESGMTCRIRFRFCRPAFERNLDSRAHGKTGSTEATRGVEWLHSDSYQPKRSSSEIRNAS
jgi:hypothetical protein